MIIITGFDILELIPFIKKFAGGGTADAYTKAQTDALIGAESTQRSNADIAITQYVNQVENIAKGANQAVSFASYSALVTSLNAETDTKFRSGQNLMVITLDVPDLWVSEVAQTSVPYTFVDDATFLEDMADSTSYGGACRIQVGYYVLSQLETQKVDLTNYYTISESNQRFGRYRFEKKHIESTNVTIQPNIHYDFGTVSELNIQLGNQLDDGYLNEYVFEFRTDSNTPIINIDDNNVLWENKNPIFNKNTAYRISIKNNFGTYLSIKLSNEQVLYENNFEDCNTSWNFANSDSVNNFNNHKEEIGFYAYNISNYGTFGIREIDNNKVLSFQSGTDNTNCDFQFTPDCLSSENKTIYNNATKVEYDFKFKFEKDSAYHSIDLVVSNEVLLHTNRSWNNNDNLSGIRLYYNNNGTNIQSTTYILDDTIYSARFIINKDNDTYSFYLTPETTGAEIIICEDIPISNPIQDIAFKLHCYAGDYNSGYRGGKYIYIDDFKLSAVE